MAKCSGQKEIPNSELAEYYSRQGLSVKNTFLEVQDLQDDNLLLLDASVQSAPAQFMRNLSLDDSVVSVRKQSNKLSAVAEAETSPAEPISPLEPAELVITTMQIRNLPNRCTKQEVLAHVDQLGFANQYNLFHMPMDKKRKSNLGYAFINFLEAETAALFQRKMKGTCVTGDRAQNCKKTCTVAAAAVQGVQNYINYLIDGGHGDADCTYDLEVENRSSSTRISL